MNGNWVLVSKRQTTLFESPELRMWTGQDYTTDPARALKFSCIEDVQRWLKARAYLMSSLRAAELPSVADGGT